MANETVLFKRGDSATITSTPVTDGQILFDTSGNGKMYLDNGTDRLEMGGAITVDASLSKTSTNAIQNKAVTGNILNSLAEVSAATQQNTIAGALALKEVNSSLGGMKFGIDSNGNYGYIKAGADTVIPFNSDFELIFGKANNSHGGGSASVTFEYTATENTTLNIIATAFSYPSKSISCLKNNEEQAYTPLDGTNQIMARLYTVEVNTGDIIKATASVTSGSTNSCSCFISAFKS